MLQYRLKPREANVICILLEVIENIRQKIRIAQTTITERKETGNRNKHLKSGLKRKDYE